MGKTVFTTITPIPAGVSRETVMDTLHDHIEMIDLNPAHDTRIQIKPPPEASAEEYHCKWYQITDKISYLPGVKGSVGFKACFHDLPMGVQVHCLAPMGLDIKQKWSLNGSLPHEPVQPVEIGLNIPINGLYLREDVELRSNFVMTKFVKNQLKEANAALVARLVVKSQLVEAVHQNRRLTYDPSNQIQFTPPLSPPMSPRQTYEPPLSPPLTGGLVYPKGWTEQSNSQRNSQYSQGHSPQPQFSQPQKSPAVVGPGQHSPAGQWQTQNYHSQLADQQKFHGQQQQQQPMELESTQTYNGQQQGHTAELQ